MSRLTGEALAEHLKWYGSDWRVMALQGHIEAITEENAELQQKNAEWRALLLEASEWQEHTNDGFQLVRHCLPQAFRNRIAKALANEPAETEVKP